MKKRMICLILAGILVLGMACAVSAASHPFEDVPEGKWYSEHIQYVYDKGLMSGTSSTRFDPEGTMTRAMAVAVLHRLAGSPEVSGSNPFKDVPAGKWYTAPVIWAVENGITAGTSATTFAPDAKVTREQLVTFLYRYATMNEEGGTSDYTEAISGYSDAGRVSKFAKTPFGWAVTNQIISGTDHSHLSPAASATRAQCATILSRFDRWLNNEDIGESQPLPTEPPAPTNPPTDPTEPPADHDHKYHVIANKDAGCTEGAYKLHWCEICGDEYKEYTSDPLGHDYYVSNETDSYSEYICSRCDHRYWEGKFDLSDEEYEKEVAKYVAYYINQFRNEEGSGTCEYLPGMAQVADYRANQLIENFEHSTPDIREAHAFYEYGTYIDATEFGDPAENSYWSSNAKEAIAAGGSGGMDYFDPAYVGKHFAENLRDSEPHWAYLVDDFYEFIAVGVEFNETCAEEHRGTWYICVMVNNKNYG